MRSSSTGGRWPSSRLGLATLSSVAILTVLSACQRPDDSGRLHVLDRWLGVELPSGSDPQGQDRRLVFRWSFESDEDIAPWSFRGFDLAFEKTGKGVYLRSSSTDPLLFRNADFLASDVDTIRIHQTELHGSFLQLFWAGEGENFAEERSLKVTSEDPGGQLVPFFSFPVHSHPLWQGQIDRLRIDPTAREKGRIEIRGLEAFRDELSSKTLALLAGTATELDVGGEVRSGLLAPVDHPLKRRIDLEPSARLRLGLAVPYEGGPTTLFRVRLRTDEGESRTLLERKVEASEARQWLDFDLDLGVDARKGVELALETSSEMPLDPSLGFPVWSTPKVLVADATSASPPNIVLVVVDTLRSDRLSLYGYERTTSPNLDRWAKRRGVVFNNVVAAAPWTLPAHVSLFTGLNAMRHGVNYTHAVPRELDLLAERLRDKGYTTVAATGGAFLHPNYGLHQGFERYSYFQQGGPQDVGKDLATGMKRTMNWLDSLPEPFFAFLHTYEVHAPYDASDPWFHDFVGSWPENEDLPSFATKASAPDSRVGWRFDSTLVETGPQKSGDEVVAADRMGIFAATYDSGIARTDQLLGRLFDHLHESGLEDNTVVVFTSDHGEALGERGRAGHAYLWDFNLKIPLIISFPDGSGAGLQVDRQVRTIDVLPTLLEEVGIIPSEDLDGRSLKALAVDPLSEFPSTAESYAGSSNYGLSLRIANRWKYIYQHAAWPPIHDQTELYDLVRDPGEQSNLASVDEELAGQMDIELRRRFVESSSHLRGRLVNGGDRSLSVSIRGDLAHAFTVKGFHLPEDSVTWFKTATEVALAPHEEILLFMEGRPEGQVSLEILASGLAGTRPSRHYQELEVGSLSSPWAVCLNENQWVSCSSVEDGQTGVEVWWHGRKFESAGATATDDKELQEQLRALGYLD